MVLLCQTIGREKVMSSIVVEHRGAVICRYVDFCLNILDLILVGIFPAL